MPEDGGGRSCGCWRVVGAALAAAAVVVTAVAGGNDGAIPEDDCPDHVADMILRPVAQKDALRATASLGTKF